MKSYLISYEKLEKLFRKANMPDYGFVIMARKLFPNCVLSPYYAGIEVTLEDYKHYLNLNADEEPLEWCRFCSPLAEIL